MTELKPCPFCGAEAGVVECTTVSPNHGNPPSRTILYGIICDGCFANTRTIYHTPLEAANAWNRRSNNG